MGYLNRLQGCLFPYTNTETVQEISEVSHPGSDIPVQGTAFWSVHSTHGVHCNSKGETDDHTQGYKNPPIPRRLFSESQIPQGLSAADAGSSKNVSTTGLASELRQSELVDASKEGWGAHLDKHIARGTWSLPESKLRIKYLEL